jgi:tripartite-type tricarboxylate transporter receptor subunit TctC
MTMIRKRLLVAAALVLATLCAGAPVKVQGQETWPTRAVKFIVPFGAGAGADIGARLFADRLSRKWGQPVVVENRPGADGVLAFTAMIHANDDHVLLFGASGSFTVHPVQYIKMPYNPQDIVPIARVSNTIVVVSAQASGPYKSLKDLVDDLRAHPGKIDAALVPGITEYAFLGFLAQTDGGLKVTKVPYRDIVQAVPDLAEGRVQVMMSSLAIVQPQVQAGKIRILCVTGRERVPQLPDIPTSAEAGFPALWLEGLAGLFGPRKLSPELRERIARDVKTVTEDGVVGSRLAATGQVMNIGGPAEFAESINQQRKQIADIAKLIGLKPDK